MVSNVASTKKAAKVVEITKPSRKSSPETMSKNFSLGDTLISSSAFGPIRTFYRIHKMSEKTVWLQKLATHLRPDGTYKEIGGGYIKPGDPIQAERLSRHLVRTDDRGDSYLKLGSYRGAPICRRWNGEPTYQEPYLD
jgi:hypothetical protein